MLSLLAVAEVEPMEMVATAEHLLEAVVQEVLEEHRQVLVMAADLDMAEHLHPMVAEEVAAGMVAVLETAMPVAVAVHRICPDSMDV